MTFPAPNFNEVVIFCLRGLEGPFIIVDICTGRMAEDGRREELFHTGNGRRPGSMYGYGALDRGTRELWRRQGWANWNRAMDASELVPLDLRRDEIPPREIAERAATIDGAVRESTNRVKTLMESR